MKLLTKQNQKSDIVPLNQTITLCAKICCHMPTGRLFGYTIKRVWAGGVLSNFVSFGGGADLVDVHEILCAALLQ